MACKFCNPTYSHYNVQNLLVVYRIQIWLSFVLHVPVSPGSIHLGSHTGTVLWSSIVLQLSPLVQMGSPTLPHLLKLPLCIYI